MHWTPEAIDSVTELARVIVPVFVSWLAYNRASVALHKARAVEAACTYPACGHRCQNANVE